jgi:hypothetical protein
LLVSGVVVSGCGTSGADNAAPSTGGSGAVGGAAGGGTGGSAGDAGVTCPDPALLSPGEICVEAVEGRVVDAQGNPVADVLTTVCGARQCNPGVAAADGRFRADVGFPLVLRDYSALPHGRPNRTSFYFQLPLDAVGPVIDVGDLPMLDLPPTGPMLVVKTDNAGAPAQSVTSGDVTLDVAEGVRVLLDVEDVAAGEDGKLFRVLDVPEDKRTVFLDASAGAFALYALMPFEAGFDIAETREPTTARLSFANRAGLPAGSLVEVLALGTYQYLDWVSPGEFEPVATARVTTDGASIELDPGEGLRYLTWVALRQKP